MNEIGLIEARAHLSEIADQVKRTGQPLALTRHGEPYVDLVPHQEVAAPRRQQAEVLAELAELRLQLPKCSDAQIRSDIDDGCL